MGPVMARTRFTASIAAFLIAAFSFASSALAGPAASADDTARFLAGLPPSAGSPLTVYTSEAFWKQHASAFDQAWDGLENRQLSKIRALVSKNFNDPKPLLFYLFSGPDFLYADAFFPSADTYVMAGLEPPGQVPDLTKFSRAELADALRELKTSLNSVLSYSFFQTKFMSYDLRKTRMPGTLPVIMVFLARSGKTIYDVSLFDLASDGTIHPSEDKVANATSKGVKIVFSDNVGKKKTIYYFSTDLSNKGIKSSGFPAFCDKLGNGDSFVKSASYLMHIDDFSTVRDYLLAHSTALLQDDSGIPVRYLTQGWKLHPFGKYVGPIGLFAGQAQSQLHEIFGKGDANATPIDFGIGYRWKPMESNLLLAVKDNSVTALAAPSPKVGDVDAKPKKEAKVEKDDGKRAPHVLRRHRQQTVSNPDSKMFGYSQ
jgi:hypothetical protein